MKLKSLFTPVVSVAALLMIAEPAQAQCAPGWTFYGSHCYAATSGSSDLNKARMEATLAGGYLTSIGSAAENNFVWTTFVSLPGNSFWIGLNDIASEGTFVWDSAEPVGYTNWWPGEPNNSNNEDGVHMIPNGPGGMWNDNNVNASFYGVIETAVVTPEPSSIALLATGLLAVAGLRRKRLQMP
jgi:hypothetical protein